MRRVAAVLVGLLLAGCSSGAGRDGAAPAAGTGAPVPVTEPYVRMTGASAGYLVWPSGDAWVVLRTTTGFRQVSNRTPLAVDTDGGLVGAFSSGTSAVAVATTGALYRSPVLLARGDRPWRPDELPGAVSGTRGAVAVRPGQGAPEVDALTSARGGTLVAGVRGRWQTVTDARRLDPRARLSLDSVTWLTRGTVMLTGHGPASAGVARLSTDGGRSWRTVPGLPEGATGALAPCGSAQRWTLPVLTASGDEVVLRTEDGGRSWRAGRPLHGGAGVTAEGCAGPHVWTVGELGGSARMLVSADAGRTWHATGTPPDGLTSLAVTGADEGYATSGGTTPRLWRVLDDGRRFIPVRLPGWVASLGAQMATS